MISRAARPFAEHRLRRARVEIAGPAAGRRRRAPPTATGASGSRSAHRRGRRGLRHRGRRAARLGRSATERLHRPRARARRPADPRRSARAWPRARGDRRRSPLLPIATARLRRSRRTPARFIALPFSSAPQVVVRSAPQIEQRRRRRARRAAARRGSVDDRRRRRGSTGRPPGRCRSRRRAPPIAVALLHRESPP